MKQRCRRCIGKRTITVPFRDGSLRRVACTVCNGSGVEWRRQFNPAESRHFASDTKEIEKETERMLKEARYAEFFRACADK